MIESGKKVSSFNNKLSKINPSTLSYRSGCNPFDYCYFQNPGCSVSQRTAVSHWCNCLFSIGLSRWNVVWTHHCLCVYGPSNPAKNRQWSRSNNLMLGIHISRQTVYTCILGAGSLRWVQCPEEPPESLAVAPWLNLLEPDDFCVRPPEDNTLLASPPPDPNDRLIWRELKVDKKKISPYFRVKSAGKIAVELDAVYSIICYQTTTIHLPAITNGITLKTVVRIVRTSFIIVRTIARS